MSSKLDFSWTLTELLNSVEAVNGALIGAVEWSDTVRFNSISTDSRTLKPGALYIAIKGEQFDGHDFIAQAIQQGAAAVLVSDTFESIVPGVCVEDTRIALGLFAKWHRLQMPLKKLIAVTGSNGKTTTKTLLRNIFELKGKTLATEGNLNNDFGLPRTLLNLRPEHEYAIIEMGANHPQEIAYLTHLALPDIAMINNASGAHLEGFGSLQGVINTKAEIFEGLNQREGMAAGVAVLNADSMGYQDWVAITERFGITDVVSFGTAQTADVQVTAFKSTDSGIEFELVAQGRHQAVSMPILGRHNAMNAAACVAVALKAGLNWSDILPGLVTFSGVPGRLQKQAIKTGWLIDDSYNANPESVKAGISALVSLPGLSVLCLGAMGELGEDSRQDHVGVAQFAKQAGVDYLFVMGEETEAMPAVFGAHARAFEGHEALALEVVFVINEAALNGQKMNVLVKGSRSAQMERVAHIIVLKI